MDGSPVDRKRKRKGTIIPKREVSLYNEKISQKDESSICLKDIPENIPLYGPLKAYLATQATQKQGDTFASIAKEDIDDIKSFEKVPKREIIFLLENSDIQTNNEPWKILQSYLIDGLYYPGESYKTRNYYESILINTGSAEFQHFSGYNTKENVYNFSKIIIKRIISVNEWGTTIRERQISLNQTILSFTYWDYIQAFNKVFYYNNDRQKHTWFIKVCAKIFTEPIPTWFLKWWSYHGPTVKILPYEFLKLYKEWVKISPDVDNLDRANHICYPERINQILFFIEFSIPWIHKWSPEVGYTEDHIPCLYRVFYNNFWNKLTKINPQTKAMHGQELIDSIIEKIQHYIKAPRKEIMEQTSVKHIARKISYQEGDKDKMINDYLEEVKRNLLQSISQMDKSDTSMKNVTSDEEAIEEAQPAEMDKTTRC